MRLLMAVFLFLTMMPGVLSITGLAKGDRLNAGEACAIGWFALVLVAAFSAVPQGMRQARREEWERRRCCVSCGYDLRASAERCPECGAAVRWRALRAAGDDGEGSRDERVSERGSIPGP